MGFHDTSRGVPHARSGGTAIDHRRKMRCRVAADNHDESIGEHDDANVDADSVRG
jgi:hypothetical protein